MSDANCGPPTGYAPPTIIIRLIDPCGLEAVAWTVDPVLLAGAARHFTEPTIQRRTEPLTPAELDAMFEDDQRALGGRNVTT